jgi:G3E family GTPase
MCSTCGCGQPDEEVRILLAGEEQPVDSKLHDGSSIQHPEVDHHDHHHAHDHHHHSDANVIELERSILHQKRFAGATQQGVIWRRRVLLRSIWSVPPALAKRHCLKNP